MADKITSLRIFTDTIRPDNGQYLRFRCITCERDPVRPPEPAAQPTEVMEPRHENIVWHVRGGSYPYLEHASGGCVVLPFDLRIWMGHLLHDVRAEWNREFISSRGVAVQAWNLDWPYKRQIELRGWPGQT